MKSNRLSIVAPVLAIAFLSLNAMAQISNNVSGDTDPTLFNGDGGWSASDIQLPGGTTIGSTPLELDLTLSHDVTLTDIGFGYNYGFGMGGLDPAIQPGGDAFNFAIELLENGTLITPTFATDFANPFTFGFDETNPFGFAVSDLGVTTSTTALD